MIPKLLEFPVVESSDPIEARNFINPFQFLKLEREWTETWDKLILPDEKVNIFLERASSDHSSVRKWATHVLGELHFLGLLAESQMDKFAESLWSILDDFDLPTETDFYKFAFLEMPHPPNVEPILLFKNYVQSEQFPVQKTREDLRISFTRRYPTLRRDRSGRRAYRMVRRRCQFHIGSPR